MRSVACLALLLCGCMEADILALRRDQALRAARFNGGCGAMSISEEQYISGGDMDFAVVGCGKRLVVRCSNAQRQDQMDRMVQGALTIEAHCQVTR